MVRIVLRAATAAAVVLAVLAGASLAVRGQSGARNGEWPTYGGELANTRYSPLDQITRENFKNLEVAWRFKTDNLGPRLETNLQSTPLMVKGVLYSTAGTRRSVVALNAASGELLWMHSEDEGQRGTSAPRQLSGRGLAYWTDGKQERILYVTPGYRLVALDAKTGVPVSGFGKSGIVDLKLENDQQTDLITGEVGLHAAPVVTKDIVIVGAAHLPGGTPKSRKNEKGFVRAYDARTGKRLWIFHTIPSPGEYGNETWENDSWSYTGNTGVWGQITVDEELGMVYLPVEMPTGDYFGGHRPGDNLFGSTLVALDLKTGQRKWHYQFIHHDIWDWDIPCAPILADIVVNAERSRPWRRRANRDGCKSSIGSPVSGLAIRRPVEQSTVPMENRNRTQRFVTKPPAFDRRGVRSMI
jgi:quinoprotein glucose dehydrogenase